MRPTLRQLEYIVAIADTGRIGAAAVRLNVSQPSLSAQLSEVETDLGVTLFRRGRAGTLVTPIGEDVVRRARKILNDLHDLRAAAQGGGIFQGRLRLGVLPSVGPYLLPGVVMRLHREHPGLRVVIREESTTDLDEGLRNGRLDLVISTPEDHPGARHTPLFRERLWAAVALDHELAATKGPIRLRALRNQTLLTLGSMFRLSHIVSGLAQRAGGLVSDEYEGTSLDAIRLMAATGAGVAILPNIYAATEARRAADVVLHAIDDPAATREIVLVEPLLREAGMDTEILAEFLRNEARRIMDGQTGPRDRRDGDG